MISVLSGTSSTISSLVNYHTSSYECIVCTCWDALFIVLEDRRTILAAPTLLPTLSSGFKKAGLRLVCPSQTKVLVISRRSLSCSAAGFQLWAIDTEGRVWRTSESDEKWRALRDRIANPFNVYHCEDRSSIIEDVLWVPVSCKNSQKSDIDIRIRLLVVCDMGAVAVDENDGIWTSESGIEFSKLNLELSVEKISAGASHFALITKSGCLHTWGQNGRGQLGHGDIEAAFVPKLVEALLGIRIVEVACGGWHTAAVSDQGDVYSFGWNVNGQTGISDDDNNTDHKDSSPHKYAVPYPVDLPMDLSFVQVACGQSHTLALTDSGCLWGWGWDKYGQLSGNSPNWSTAEGLTIKPSEVAPCKGIKIRRMGCGSWISWFEQ